MRIKYSLTTAIAGIAKHKSRSLLTIIGIVIGISSIILIMSLGQGARDLILEEIRGTVSSRVIEIRPGRSPKGPADILTVFSDSLTERDLNALKRKGSVPYLGEIMPLVFSPETAYFSNEVYQVTLYGATELARDIYKLKLAEGRFLEEEDVKGNGSVIVIGWKVREKLFSPGEEVLGKKIKIKGRNFTVVGVLPKGGQTIASFDDAIWLPYTSAQVYILGYKHFNHIIVEADLEENVARTVEDIVVTLRDSHNITDPEKDDFHVQSVDDAVKTINTVMSVLALLITSVAAISLVVGGVGIMNIMLVSVTERTREIGLRKALGATNRAILTQFLLEAVMLTALGGIIGILLGAGLAFVAYLGITNFTTYNWIYSFPIQGAIIGLVVASAVGLLFGIYPAYQASKKSPMEALRYE